MNYSLYNAKETDTIIQLFIKTFGDSEGQSVGEQIGGLVTDLITTTPEQDLYVCIAKEEEVITGAILFTRMTYESEQQSFLMAPVAVHTDYQGKGIGQALIQFGLEAMRNEGINIAFTYGDPNFYTKSGFKPVEESAFKAPLPLSFPHGWMAQSLTGSEIDSLAGDSQCVPAFNKPEFW
ncbi:GNAT family N-acetyltransferase [Vibrio sp. TBV020]|uniref:GNAT family N-acetyltransferase n=1 Tax=Vibrio sp. TBV020 TaxID=3137398 RepID=UPI0038CD281E